MSSSILITTIHSQNNNFGSVWQGFALSYYLEANGFQVSTLDYRPYYSNGLTSLRRAVQQVIKSILFGSIIRKRDVEFQSFISSRPLTRRFKTYEEVVAGHPDADVFLLGSDQVWNPSYMCGRDPVYYLEFVRDAPKVAYSASIGRLLTDNELEALIQRILPFRAVSLREDQSAQQLYHAGRLDVVHTLDPVFLLKKYDYIELAAHNVVEIEGRYILAYIIESDSVIASVVEAIKEATGMTVVQIGGLASKCAYDKFIRDAGPLDFINLVNRCDLLITSSFHGTAFAHILEKDFICVMPSENQLRIESLLRDAGTIDRVVSNADEALKLVDTRIDYLCVQERLSPLIDMSKHYLLSSLRESERKND